MTFPKTLLLVAVAFSASAAELRSVPANLVADGIPPIPEEIVRSASRYEHFRTAAFQSWEPKGGGMLIGTRFADVNQLHLVAGPGAARRQITFGREPVGGGAFQPKGGRFIVYLQDQGGGEFFQLFRLDPANGETVMLTDGKSRNIAPRWSNKGDRISYSSTRRNGRDTDIWLIDPANPSSDRLLFQVEGGGWAVSDWSPDDTKLLLTERVSINESYLWLADLGTGSKTALTERTGEKVAYDGAAFSKDGKSVITATDKGAEFLQLTRMDLATREYSVLIGGKWDVSSFALSDDGKHLAYVKTEDGVSILRVANARNGRTVWEPKLPLGVIGGLEWHPDNRTIGFTFSSARSAGDAYSADLKARKVQRWTFSETGGLNPETFAEPELIKVKSFDGLEFAAFVYRPDSRKFPGKRPAIVYIHGGPESMSRPGFLGRFNYLLNEMGIAFVVPNVRGSAGYGKTFLTLDNGSKREDSVKDIGAVLDWIARDRELNADRVAVYGGSYGGYMVLASMIHFGDRLRAGIDVVGISNFLTFLANTQDYRRDLRRVEYGDERDAAMREFLQKISPSARAAEIKDPLLIVQGKNDPRVPLSESEQMLAAVRRENPNVWYLMATDEGHGFRKKPNQDYEDLVTYLFFRTFLLN